MDCNSFIFLASSLFWPGSSPLRLSSIIIASSVRIACQIRVTTLARVGQGYICPRSFTNSSSSSSRPLDSGGLPPRLPMSSSTQRNISYRVMLNRISANSAQVFLLFSVAFLSSNSSIANAFQTASDSAGLPDFFLLSSINCLRLSLNPE